MWWQKRTDGLVQYFLSFEDALWRYLRALPLAKKTMLVPDFFCSDVTSRLIDRGYKIATYPLDSNLCFDKEAFTSVINQNQDIGAVIIYYPLGDRSSVPSVHWFRERLDTDTLLIEDLADVVLDLAQDDPSWHTPIDRHHIIIDSFRKNLPLQGARLFSLTKCGDLAEPFTIDEAWYLTKASALHFTYSLCNLIGDFFNLKAIRTLKWTLFGLHSDLIGSFNNGARACFLTELLFSTINLSVLKQARQVVLQQYQAQNPFIDSKQYQLLPQNQTPDVAIEIRFPVLRGPKGTLSKLANELEQDEIFVDIHFDDSPRANAFDFLLLPLHPHYTKEDIQRLWKAITHRLQNLA